MSCNCGLPTCSLCGTGGSCGPGILHTGSTGCVTDCQSRVPATPTPYYAGCSACPEDHVKNVIIQSFAASLKVVTSWNVPECDAFATVTIPGLSSITIGSYLWNPTYGFFQVTGFNASTQQVTILNTCVEGNATAGTQVPPCTDFNLSAPPCNCSNQNPDLFPYVAVDFTAPSDGDCMNITVTNVNGLQVGKEVAIWTGIYTLDAIVNPTTITICNDGEGLTPGTIVEAFDGAGNYQYPVVLIDSNPCASDSDTTGSVVVCHEDVQVPLASLIPGTPAITEDSSPGNIVVPALTGTDLVEAEYITIDAKERLCTTTTAAVPITNGDATYSFPVTSVTDFQDGDVLEIAGRTERFTITSIVASTINVTAVPTPGADGNVPSGSWLCLITCCEELAYEIRNPVVGSASSLSGNLGDLDSGNPIITSALVTYTLPNPLTNNLLLFIQYYVDYGFTLVGANTGEARVVSQFEVRFDGGAYQTIYRSDKDYYTRSDATTEYVESVPVMVTGGFVAGVAHTIDFRATFGWGAGAGPSADDVFVNVDYVVSAFRV